MNRRNSRTSHANHERWLVSYADFITLLFGLFVVLFAASNADKEKIQKFAQAVESAIQHSGVRTGAIPSVAKPREPVLNSTYTALAASLQPELAKRQVRLALETRGLVITLNQTAFFDTGSADFDTAMYGTLGKIAQALAGIDNPIRLEGHTDSRPIHNEQFNNNWELSTARSIAVLELLIAKFGIEPARMAVSGYADTAPVSPNDSDEGRARNRRVDIVVLSRDALSKGPGGRRP
jgi:chemotaxis protein MotB